MTVVVLTGEGGYGGLTAHVMVDWTTGSEDTLPSVAGAVVPGEAPPFPEVRSATE